MTTSESTAFDYKRVVQAEWASDETAAAWHKYYAPMKRQLGGVTAALVKEADPKPGMLVLDLASGAGQPALAIAPHVLPGGRVVATDLSEPMLAVLREHAVEEGVKNVETRFADAHELPFEDGEFDLVTCRFGAMFFVEIDRALAEIRRVLKPGGRAVFAVWGQAAPGTYFGSAIIPFMKRLENKPDPDGPSPMRYGEPGKLKGLMEKAGFERVKEDNFNVPAPWEGRPDELLSRMFEIAAPFRNAAESLAPEVRAEAEREALANLARSYDGKEVTVIAPLILVSAER